MYVYYNADSPFDHEGVDVKPAEGSQREIHVHVKCLIYDHSNTFDHGETCFISPWFDKLFKKKQQINKILILIILAKHELTLNFFWPIRTFVTRWNKNYGRIICCPSVYTKRLPDVEWAHTADRLCG